MTRSVSAPACAFVERPDVDRYRPWMTEGSLKPAIAVSDHLGTDTGLLDAGGNKIMRAPRGVGFHATID